MRSWWLTGTGGPGSYFMLVTDGQRLLGGLALEEVRRLGLACLHLMGTGHLCPDLDLLAVRGQEEAVIGLLRTWLCRPGRRFLNLEGVRAGSRLIEALPSAGPVRFAGRGTLQPAARRWTVVSGWPALQLPSSGPASLGPPGGAGRHPSSPSGRLGAPVPQHTARAPPLPVGRPGSRFLPAFERFAAGCRQGAEADEIVVHELVAEGTVISTIMAFEVAGRVSLYQSARVADPRWREAPAVLLNAIIADACARGFSEVDFLRGDEPYKDRFAPQRRELIRLLAGKGVSGRAVWASARRGLPSLPPGP